MRKIKRQVYKVVVKIEVQKKRRKIKTKAIYVMNDIYDEGKKTN